MEEQIKEKIMIHPDEDIRELIPRYLANRHKDVRALYEALDQADFYQVQNIGHIMSGSGTAYGFDEISAIGILIETAAKKRDKTTISEQLSRLEDYLSRLEII